MQYIPPTKKSFSFSALARWGERLASAPNERWEEFLAAGSVEKGQALYREISHVVEIFLEDNNASVQFRTEDDGDVFVFFSVGDKGALHWRSSLENREEAAPYAVAGMYFIEEFVGDEFPTLPTDICQREQAQKSSAEKTKPEQEKSDPAKNPETERKLKLTFSAGTTSLSCHAKWSEKSNGTTAPALGKNAVPVDKLSKTDREQLLRLATFARKAFFSYDTAAGCYTLHGASLANAFADSHFSKWSKYFTIEDSEAVEIFRREPRELDAEAILDADSTDSFSLRWEFELDGKALTKEEADAVISHANESVFLPGHGVVRIRSHAKSFISDWPDPSTHGIPIYTLLSLFRNERAAKIVPDAKLIAWRKKILSEPKAVSGTPEFLRPYQARGVAWLRQMFNRKVHPLLADEMGLGKTLQVLSLLSIDTRKKANTLIVCPASVVPVWKNEIAKFFPHLTFSVLGANDDMRHKKSAGTTAKILLSSYGQLRRHESKIARKRFEYAILDEAQFIKNPQTKIAQTCFKINATHRLALTGTPIENRHLDLWTLFRFLMPGLLGRRADLENTLSDANNNPEVLERLRTQIAPFILRRTKSEVEKELPEKTQIILHCPMLDQQREHYMRLVRDGLSGYKKLTGTSQISTQNAMHKNPTNLLALLMRLRQAACDPALLPGCSELSTDHSGKISVLLERVQEIIDNGGKIVIFSQFVTLLDRVHKTLQERFAGTPLYTLTGKTLDRDTPVKKFQGENGSAIFLVSLRAGGTGLTLHSAEYVFLLDPWWNPAVEEQAIDRVHRIGQKKRVFVYRMVSAGTIEDRIEKLKQSKRELFNTLVGGIPDMSDWAEHYPSLESLISLSE